MNVYEWMSAQSDQGPPMQDDDPRENPGNRPHLPDENDDDEMHCTEHTMQDPHMLEDLTSSNESIIEPIRKFFKLHNRGSDYIEVDGNNKANGVQLLQTLEKTYGSKEWLSKQSHKPGQVKVGDLADRLNFDKIEQTITETGAINAQFQNAQIEAILTNIKQIKPAASLLTPPKLTDEAFDKLKAILPNIKPVTEVIKNPVRSKTSLISGKTSDETREALGIDEVEGIANAIAKALKEAQLIWEDAAKSIDQLIPAFHEANVAVVDKGAHSPGYNNEAWSDLLGAVRRKLFGQGSPDVIAAYRQFEGACLAAVIYMERSFTGGKSVSNEDFSDLGEKLGGFFRHRPKDLTVEGDHNYQNAKKLISATFMNDSWLKQQTFSDKPIKVSFPGNLTKFDHSIIDTIRSDSQEHKAKGKQFLDEGFKPVNEVVGYLFAHGWEKDPTHADQLLKSVDFKFHAKHPDVEIAKPSVKQTLPPLDKRSIKKIAQTFLDLVELKKELWDEHLLRIWKIFGVEGKHYEKGGKRYREADATNAPPSVYKMFEKLHKYGEDFEASFYEYNQAYTHILQPTADGLLRWMTHSLTNFKAPK